MHFESGSGVCSPVGVTGLNPNGMEGKLPWEVGEYRGFPKQQQPCRIEAHSAKMMPGRDTS